MPWNFMIIMIIFTFGILYYVIILINFDATLQISYPHPENTHLMGREIAESGGFPGASFHNNSKSQSTIDGDSVLPERRNKSILFWTDFWFKNITDWYPDINKQFDEYCPIKSCKILIDQSDVTNADVVVFHSIDINNQMMNIRRMTRTRSPQQNWAILFFEAPPLTQMYVDLYDFNGIFNLTMSYRRDSDVFLTFGFVKKKRSSSKEEKKKPVNGGLDKSFLTKSDQVVSLKTKSNSTGKNGNKSPPGIMPHLPVQIFNQTEKLKSPIEVMPHLPVFKQNGSNPNSPGMKLNSDRTRPNSNKIKSNETKINYNSVEMPFNNNKMTSDFAHKNLHTGRHVYNSSIQHSSSSNFKTIESTDNFIDETEQLGSNEDLPSVWQNKNKEKMAVWIVSKCITASGREKLVRQLKKHINIEIIGACGKQSCGAWNGDQESDPCKNTINSYMFYLSFENSICVDYITEKFFKILRLDVIPVVFGGGDYNSIAPPNSFINVNDFHTTDELAQYLKKVATDPELYNSYMKWKLEYESFTLSSVLTSLCSLCAYVHGEQYIYYQHALGIKEILEKRKKSPYIYYDSNTGHQVYYDLDNWYNLESRCQWHHNIIYGV